MPRMDRGRRSAWLRGGMLIAVTVSTTVATSTAVLGIAWAGVLASGSTGQNVTSMVSNLTITAVASTGHQTALFPGGSGDVSVTIHNPNGFRIEVTGMRLPTKATLAAGYTSDTLARLQPGCTAADSGVSWTGAATDHTSAHRLRVPLVVGANASLAVVLANAAFMSTTAPASCEDAAFVMPPLAAVAAKITRSVVTPSPATDAWTK